MSEYAETPEMWGVNGYAGTLEMWGVNEYAGAPDMCGRESVCEGAKNVWGVSEGVRGIK